MPDPEIKAFFAQRKEKWLKSRVKSNMLDLEKNYLEEVADQIFSLEDWLPRAAKRACSRAFTTHPSKFSHPSTGIGKKNRKNFTYVTPVICEADRQPDGYLRTGNASSKRDSVGNAAELDVDDFLNLQMQDGKSLLMHIQQDSQLAQELLSIQSVSYETLKKGLLAMADSNSEMVTSSKIKQVYFPVNDDYHQFSVLSNSGLIYELRDRIDELRFPKEQEQKQLREFKRTNVFSERGFTEIYDIATIGYGGTKPQNISALNKHNGGKAHLLLSMPPALEQREVHFPKHDFFKESIRFYDIRESLEKLHRIFTSEKDSVIPRRNLEIGRDHHLEEILDLIILRVVALRQVATAQYREETNQLEQYQKIWLCPGFETQREQEDEWLKQLCKTITNWITTAYSKTIKKSITFGQAEKAYIQQVIETHGEALR
ncbi:MAG: type I-F CRISPR-associated protein Csy1 [Gammaproteobacteria bacterium]|nr:type I-F CRISPR-associated protein Csy1 [Gammaproteobacteria bacterium]